GQQHQPFAGPARRVLSGDHRFSSGRINLSGRFIHGDSLPANAERRAWRNGTSPIITSAGGRLPAQVADSGRVGPAPQVIAEIRRPVTLVAAPAPLGGWVDVLTAAGARRRHDRPMPGGNQPEQTPTA